MRHRQNESRRKPATLETYRYRASRRLYVCLAKVHRCRGCKPHPATLAPAGSTRGGSGGDEWSEALREKVPSGDQRAIRAAAQANTDEASKGSNVRADPPVERGGRRRQASERDTPLTVSPG